MINLKPYILPRPSNGYNIPIAIQTSFIKQYADKNNYKFSLPLAELTTSNSFFIFENYLNQNKNSEIGIVTAFIFPLENKILMNKIFQRYKKSNIKIHAILESEVFSIEKFLHWSNEITELRSISKTYSDFNMDYEYN